MAAPETSDSPPTVCIIDSDPAIRDSLRTLINLNGHAVQCYSTSYSFWTAVQALTPKCILCEAELPDSSGFDVHAMLIDQQIDVPFALLISGNLPLFYARAARAGIHRIYRKPLVNTQGLLEFVGSN